MQYRKDITSGALIGAVSIIYLLLTCKVNIFTGPGAAPLSARFVPAMWGTILLILSVLLLVRGLRNRKAALQKRGAAEQSRFSLKGFYLQNTEVILTFAVLAAYIYLLKPVGFLIMSALYIFAEALILSKKGKRRVITALVLAVTASVLIDFVFVRLLYVMLPKGILGF